MDKISLVLVCAAFGTAMAVAAQNPARIAIGGVLPTLEGSYLTGAKARLPEGARGKTALLALGFTYESRHAVEPWCERFAKEFAGAKDVTFYEIPVIGGMGRIARWFIDSGMRRGTPKEKQENVITVYGGADQWKQRVGFSGPDDAYLVLLNSQGVIQWLHAGRFNEAKFAELAEAARRIRASAD